MFCFGVAAAPYLAASRSMLRDRLLSFTVLLPRKQVPCRAASETMWFGSLHLFFRSRTAFVLGCRGYWLLPILVDLMFSILACC